MLSEEQIQEIREHIEKAQNPLFFFDNDADGLCSFLLLARYAQKGKGVAIKSYPDLNQGYLRKIHELNPDYIFVLDKPEVSQEFIDGVKKLNLPFVWIDHHDVDIPAEKLKDIYYYNSHQGKDEINHPVTYISYKVSGIKDDIWLATCGCIADNFMPDFIKEFEEKYPELWKKDIKTPFQALYEADLGKIIQIFSFGLKDRISNVVRMLKYLLKLSSPQEILKEISGNQLLKRYNHVNQKYQRLFEKAKNVVKESKLIYFQYGGELSLSADLANELYYKFPGKIIAVVYLKGEKANVSLRGDNVKDLTEKAIEEFEDATGGGHRNATGAKVNTRDLNKFKEKLIELTK